LLEGGIPLVAVINSWFPKSVAYFSFSPFQSGLGPFLNPLLDLETKSVAFYRLSNLHFELGNFTWASFGLNS